MADIPTYASLTPLAPANPAILNGLAAVDLQPAQQLTNNDQNVTMGLLNAAANGHLSVLPPNSNVSHNVGISRDPKPDLETPQYEKNTLIAVLQFLRKNNLKDSEEQLRSECGFFDEIDSKSDVGLSSDVSTVLSSYKNEGDPTEYEESYQSLVSFVERTLDSYKYEVSQVLYPVFVHMYLELVYNEHENMAISFLEKFSNQQEDYFQEDILSLSLVTMKDHMNGYQIMDAFRSSQYRIRISRDAYAHLKRFIGERSGSPVSRVTQERLSLDVYDGVPRTKSQVKATSGALEGEACSQVNRTKVYYGLPKEPELQNVLMEEEEGEEESEKPKKKKAKKDSLQKNKKNDPNAPHNNRVPLPDLRDIDKVEKAKAYRDAMKRVTLNKENLPSICFYTFLNSAEMVTAVSITDDSSLLAYGTVRSAVYVHCITPNKLKSIKHMDQLDDIDKYADDVLVRMMDERSAEHTKCLTGHTGPIYACSFSPDRTLLLTASQDGTVRLWSLQTWTCLVTYKGHIYPVWDVKFCNTGYYFVSGGQDRTARLWATDHHQPLRIFAGHQSDVDAVEFHPNCNYIVTGSSDRSIRVWDIVNGNCVRVLTGHKAMINVLAVSPCGRYLASGGADNNALIWDFANGNMVAEMASHKEPIYTVAFSRDNTVLATGGLDNCIKLWDFAFVNEENSEEDSTPGGALDRRRTKDSLLLASFSTKNTPVMAAHFTRRNVLLAAGTYSAEVIPQTTG